LGVKRTSPHQSANPSIYEENLVGGPAWNRTRLEDLAWLLRCHSATGPQQLYFGEGVLQRQMADVVNYARPNVPAARFSARILLNAFTAKSKNWRHAPANAH